VDFAAAFATAPLLEIIVVPTKANPTTAAITNRIKLLRNFVPPFSLPTLLIYAAHT
jgi:hypothetical protein